MSTAAFRRATYADIEALPENVVGELVAGELIVSPRPSPRHARAASSIGGELHGPFDRGRGGPGGWIILDEPELHFVEDVVVPDLAGWRRDKMPELPTTAYFTQAPDWLCEVLSPATARVDRALKLPLYARQSVGNVWVVDPLAKTLEVFRMSGKQYVLAQTFEGGALVRAEPFDAVELRPADFWDERPTLSAFRARYLHPTRCAGMKRRHT